MRKPSSRLDCLDFVNCAKKFRHKRRDSLRNPSFIPLLFGEGTGAVEKAFFFPVFFYKTIFFIIKNQKLWK